MQKQKKKTPYPTWVIYKLHVKKTHTQLASVDQKGPRGKKEKKKCKPHPCKIKNGISLKT